MLRKLFITLSAALVVACSSEPNTMYYWGNYNDVVYDYYNQKGDLTVQEQALIDIISRAKEKGKPVGPGVYGYLGFIQLKQGKQADARNSFAQEKALYSESAQFMQFIERNGQLQLGQGAK